MMMPLLDKLREFGYTDYKKRKLINDLLFIGFEYDHHDVGREILKYEKKEYFPDNIIKQIKEYLQNS